MKPNLKQQGNIAFKNKNYKQAIKLYDQYVQQEHPDNKNAFFNLGLCYSKIAQHHKSIQACHSAITIDPTYQKPYYRLMKEYFDIGHTYQTFVNALHYIKTEKDVDSQQVVEAKHFLKVFKEKFISSSYKIVPSQKLKDSDDIFSIIDPLKPHPEINQQFNQQIDKYPNEWIDEWNQGIQSQDAKWEEISYIAKQIDLTYGISLAYFYFNQITDKKKRDEIGQKIKQMKKEANIQQRLVEDVYQSCYTASTEIEKAEQKEEDYLEPSNTPLVQPKPASIEAKQSNRKLPLAQESKQNTIKVEQNEKTNKIQDLLVKKSQNRKICQQSQTLLVIDKQLNNKNHKQSKTQQKKQVNMSLNMPSTPKFEELRLQQLYNNYCGNLQKTKDIFNEVFKSIFSILNSKQSSSSKGSLLISIKKRIKKFKLIVTSFSENEQKVIFDLLKKSNIQEYAVDFAPAFHRV